MAGVYIHVPFCKQKCSYCDFHFSTDSSYVDDMTEAMCTEMSLRDWPAHQLETVYFGGGTPSILSATQLTKLIEAVKEQVGIAEKAEITLEANPDDIDEAKLSVWKDCGINRLSIGIQSFNDSDLKSMNRAHDASMSRDCVSLAQKMGFDNISVDMMYGLPNQKLEDFEKNVDQFLALDVDHISAYNLTIEKGTAYGRLMEKGLLSMPPEEQMEEQFLKLRRLLSDAGYEQYEVSNFARRGKISRHNSAYWTKQTYVGIGPSAHSFNGESRMWNVANNHRYMKGVTDSNPITEEEKLSEVERYNEEILTGLRTKWGVNLARIKNLYGIDLLAEGSALTSQYNDMIEIEQGSLRLNERGLLIADRIASDLFRLD